jgi:hypothetical protein
MVSVLAIVAIIAHYPAYLERPDFWGRTLALQRDPAEVRITEFLHRTTTDDAIVLASSDLSLNTVAPSGRRIVALNPVFSNPYVDLIPRVRDRQMMFDALTHGDRERFDLLTDRYSVSHVLVKGDSNCRDADRATLILTRRDGKLCLFEILSPERSRDEGTAMSDVPVKSSTRFTADRVRVLSRAGGTP